LFDQAAWHATGMLEVPANITLILLPPTCPELNVAENIWQYLRQTYLSNRVFEAIRTSSTLARMPGENSWPSQAASLQLRRASGQ